MKNRKMSRVFIVLVMAIGVIWLGACAGNTQSSDPVMDEPVDGAAMLEASCTKCHNLDRVTSAQKTEAEWVQNVDKMIQKGAEVADKEALVAYLSETYAP